MHVRVIDENQAWGGNFADVVILPYGVCRGSRDFGKMVILK
jgi:hypothetical protein